MIRVYTGFRGLAFPLFLSAGLVLFFAIFFWGFAKAIELLLPLLVVFSYLIIAVFVLGFLPATFIKNLRPSLGVYSLWMSQMLGVLTWMMSFLFVVRVLGLLGIILAFLFQLLAPVALVGAALKGQWSVAGNLILWIGFAYAMKIYGQRLLDAAPQVEVAPGKNPDIIDVDAREIQ